MSDGALPLVVQAGPVMADFEPWSGWLRSVRRGREVLVLAVYAAVRDDHWGTLRPVVEVTRRDLRPDSFVIEWSLTYPELGFSFAGSAKGEPTGEIIYRVEGRPTRGFSTARTGLCLLHPRTQAGRGVKVFHGEGKISGGHLPEWIAPHEPFRDIRAIEVEGLVKASFSGETFEMEDQRNWCDASFKTYCRSNSWEIPYRVEAAFQHSVLISPLDGGGGGADQELRGAMPQVSFRVRAGAAEPPLGGPWFVDLVHEEWEDHELLVLEKGSPVTGFWAPGRPAPGISTVAVGRPEHVEPARRAFPGAEVVLAGRGGFVELNRMEPKPVAEGTLFALQPQVHAFDDRSILENLLAIPDLVASARRMSSGRVIVGPVGFSSSPTPADDRYRNTLVGAAWRAASLLMLAASGVDEVIFWESAELEWDTLEWAGTLRGLKGLPVVKEASPRSWDVLSFRVGDQRVAVNLTAFPQEDQGGALAPYEVKYGPIGLS